MAGHDEVKLIEAALRAEGWAHHTSVAREVQTWVRLTDEVNNYTLTVDDYTNDLSSRDYLAEVLARSSSGLGAGIEAQVAPADESFREATIEDIEEHLCRYIRVEPEGGWWWRRRPSTGPLAAYLLGTD